MVNPLHHFKIDNFQPAKGAVKFTAPQKTQFFAILKKRVDDYFVQHQLAKSGEAKLALKTAVLLAMYVLPFVALLRLQPGWGGSLLLWATMGAGLAGLGMSVMHDANHGAYSARPLVNWMMAHVLNLMGGSTYNWKLQHNILHHTYTNVTHLDDDIATKPGLRLSPHVPAKKAYRYQWLHAFLLYGLTTLYWVTAKDFVQWIRYRKNKVNRLSPGAHRLFLFKLIALKLFHFFTFLVVPSLFFALPFIQVLAGFCLMHFVAGLILTVIFQLAHSLEGTAHPLPDSHGVIENDWAIHQLHTTMNFSPHNRLLSWYIGGLNYQVEHHLFSRISHVHYPAIAPIVQRTAAEFGIPYLQHRSFGGAFRAHVAFLRRLGKLPDLEEAIG
jgi:linoleoyl-CoA desaturase